MGGLREVRHHHTQASLPERNRRGQSRRAATHDENIGVQYVTPHQFHLRRTSSEQKPGPMAASTE